MTTYSDIRYDMGLSTSATGVGGLVLLATETASSSDTIDFTSKIDSLYKEYIFKFINVHPATDAAELSFQANAAGGSGFDETITSTYFRAVHNEADTAATLTYDANRDQAQGTGFQEIASDVGNENDQSTSGYLHLFDPSSTTFTKHFILRSSVYIADTGARDQFVAGYFNTTSAIDEIQFKMSSGNIDAGTFKMYGVL